MEATEHIWMDGSLIPWDEAKVHVLSHGIHYGTGAFEGIRAYDAVDGTAIFRLTDHMERLQRSTKALGIPFEYTVDGLVEAAKELMRANKLQSGYIRPVTFFGTGSMGLNPAGARVHMVIAAWEWGAYLGEEGVRDGIRVAVSSWRRIGQNSFMPDAKGTGGYMNSVLAKTAAIRAGYDEALLLNEDGLIAEGSGENLFMVRKGIVHTPPTSAGALDGLTRSSVYQLLEEDGYTIKESAITRSDLYYADEVFFTGTAAEVTPVREVDDRPVGDGIPGPVTRRAQELFMGAVTGKLDLHPEWREYI
ncbi:MAG: branched-chain amino acid transaminase [Actinomycetota bacterium]|jgi:branched-chain amino acid aminotransferase|nr:branched-chain amino acid transaminase [Actinomycetota bacterium]